MVAVLIAWLLLSVVIGVVIGKAIHHADVAELTSADAGRPVLDESVPVDRPATLGEMPPHVAEPARINHLAA